MYTYKETTNKMTGINDKNCECGNNFHKGLVKGRHGDEMRCEDCDIDGKNYEGGLTDEETEKDVCVGCDKVVVVSYGDECVGYSIANCDTCDKMLCRECLDTDIESLCKYCHNDNFIKWTEEDFCDRDTCYFCKTKDIWQSKHEDAVCDKCAEVWKYDEDDDGYRKCK